MLKLSYHTYAVLRTAAMVRTAAQPRRLKATAIGKGSAQDLCPAVKPILERTKGYCVSHAVRLSSNAVPHNGKQHRHIDVIDNNQQRTRRQRTRCSSSSSSGSTRLTPLLYCPRDGRSPACPVLMAWTGECVFCVPCHPRRGYAGRSLLLPCLQHHAYMVTSQRLCPGKLPWLCRTRLHETR